MKFRYKKLIVTITMCTMCIGMVTISLITPQNKEENKKENIANISKENISKENITHSSEDEQNLMEEAGIDDNEVELEISNQEEWNKIAETYLNSRLSGDEERLKKIVTDVKEIDMSDFQKIRNLIDEYKNIECYTIGAEKEGNYIVYIYYEILFKGATETAPGLDRVYVVTTDDGTLKLDFGLLSQEARDLITQSESSEEVQRMIDTVDYKLEAAISKDEELRKIVAFMNSVSDVAADNKRKESNSSISQEANLSNDKSEDKNDVQETTNSSGNTAEKEETINSLESTSAVQETEEPLENTEAVRE